MEARWRQTPRRGWICPYRAKDSYCSVVEHVYLREQYDEFSWAQLEKDIEKNNYNALIALSKKEDFDEKCEEMLNFVLAECSHRFEKLPCVEDVEILRNILYAGVWDKFNQKRMKKDGE